jgi:hypothetical protein
MAGSLSVRKKNAAKVKKPSSGDYLRTAKDMLVVNPRNSPAATLGGAAYDYVTKSTPRSVVRDIRNTAQDAGDWLRKEGKAIRAAPITESLRLLKAGYIDPLADPYRVFKQAATERARGNTTGGKKLAAMVPLAVAGVLPQGRGASKVATKAGVDAATKTATKKATKAATPSMTVTPKAKSKPPSLLSAVRVGGKTYTGPTHLDALDAIPDPKVRSQASLDANSRGFVNERGKYMDRFKAADYARNFDLFSPDAPDWAKTAPEVISENLRLPELAVKAQKKGPDVVQRKTRNISKAKAEGPKIVGAPLGVNTPADEALRRKEYANTMELGRAGASWYDDSGKAILENVGDDPAKARRAAEVFSITSSGTGVPANTGFAVKGMNQASYGDPVDTGRFPTAMGGQIEDLYRGDTAVTGKKRTPFADQLAIGGGFYDPSVTGQGHRGVHDIWDGEAWGYTDAEGRPIRRAFQDAEHNWMDRQMSAVLKNYVNDPDIQGLPGRGQAATWTGAKIQAGDIKPEDAAYSYADDISRLYAQGSREAVPGSNTGNLQGLLDAPFEQRKAYTDEFMPIFFDEAGRDRIALNNDMLVGESFEGPGIYEGVNPGRQAQYAVGTKRVEVPNTKSTDPRIDPASRNLMLNNEAIFGLLGAQKGIAGNRFFTDVPKSRSNAFEINVGDRPISYDEGNAALSVLSRAGFTPDDFAIVPSPRGVRAMDLGVFDEDLVRMQAENPEMYKQAIKDRMERLNRLSGELGNEIGGTSTPGFMDSIYAENAFDTPEGMFGQQYLPYIFPDDRPQFVDRFNAIAPGMAEKLRELDKRTSKDYGFDISSNIDDMRAAIAAEGEAGLRELIRRRGLGKAKGGAVERHMVNAAGDLGLLSEKYA